MSRISLITAIFVLFAGVGRAEDNIRLSATDDFAETGILKYLLPRFSLKTGIRLDIVDDGADVQIVTEGGRALAVIAAAPDTRFGVNQTATDKRTQRFVDWLFSDIGKRTLMAYTRDGVVVFAPPTAAKVAKVVAKPQGDVTLGEKLSLLHCGRCHVVSDRNKFAGIGSTPSFRALRALPAWQDRFEAFWTLNPHPSFTQIAEITEPFPPDRPPAIAPIELTLEEAEAIAAYAVTIEPADLGADIFAQ